MEYCFQLYSRSSLRWIWYFKKIEVFFGTNKKWKWLIHWYLVVTTMMHIVHQLLHETNFVASHASGVIAPKKLEILTFIKVSHRKSSILIPDWAWSIRKMCSPSVDYNFFYKKCLFPWMIDMVTNATKKHCDVIRKLVLLLNIRKLVLLLNKLVLKSKVKLEQHDVQITIKFY